MLGIDSLARNCLRACVWVSVLLFCVLLLWHLLNSFCLPPRSSWCFFYELERNVCFCPQGSRNTGLLIFFGDPAVLLIAMMVLAVTLEEVWEQYRLVIADEHSSTATLAPTVTARGNPYHSALACRQWPVRQVSRWCCVGVTLCFGVLAAAEVGSLASPLLLAPACWAQTSLWSVFWEEWQILGTSKVVF